MKRIKLIDRVAFIAEKRSQLFAAAREASGTFASQYARETAEKELELRALAYGLAVIRYIGGQS